MATLNLKINNELCETIMSKCKYLLLCHQTNHNIFTLLLHDAYFQTNCLAVYCVYIFNPVSVCSICIQC